MTYPYFVGYVSIKDLPKYKEEDIKKSEIINLAFAHIEDGVVVSKLEEYKSYLEKIKTINPGIKLYLSIGGWSADGFSESASTQANRTKFIESSIEHVKKYSLDGIDLDWEYPCIGIAGIKASRDDKKNFTYLLKEFRETLDKKGMKDIALTIAVAGDEYYIQCTEMDKVQRYVDYVQLMTYDLRGGFTVQTGHHANLYSNQHDLSRASAKKAVDDYIKAGVPREKLILGVAFYSRMWKGVPDVDCGYMQMAKSTGGYGPPFHELQEHYIDKNGYNRYWDDEAKAPFLFNGETFISYDDQESLLHKINYVKEESLGGIMYWEYGTDTTGKLLDFVYATRRKELMKVLKNARI